MKTFSGEYSIQCLESINEDGSDDPEYIPEELDVRCTVEDDLNIEVEEKDIQKKGKEKKLKKPAERKKKKKKSPKVVDDGNFKLFRERMA